jgi:hypothetical protein
MASLALLNAFESAVIGFGPTLGGVAREIAMYHLAPCLFNFATMATRPLWAGEAEAVTYIGLVLSILYGTSFVSSTIALLLSKDTATTIQLMAASAFLAVIGLCLATKILTTVAFKKIKQKD